MEKRFWNYKRRQEVFERMSSRSWNEGNLSDDRFSSAKESEVKARSKSVTITLVATMERTKRGRWSTHGLQDDVPEESGNRGKMMGAL